VVNLGTGEDITIYELAELVMQVVGFKGKIIFDLSKPDGTPRKLLSIERMKQFGWQAKFSLQDGIALAYANFIANNVAL
jgi:GDP-L-fucose synthase